MTMRMMDHTDRWHVPPHLRDPPRKSIHMASHRSDRVLILDLDQGNLVVEETAGGEEEGGAIVGVDVVVTVEEGTKIGEVTRVAILNLHKVGEIRMDLQRPGATLNRLHIPAHGKPSILSSLKLRNLLQVTLICLNLYSTRHNNPKHGNKINSTLRNSTPNFLCHRCHRVAFRETWQSLD